MFNHTLWSEYIPEIIRFLCRVDISTSKKNVTASRPLNSDICRAQEFKSTMLQNYCLRFPCLCFGITKRSQWDVWSSYHCPQNRLKSLTVFAVMSFWQEWLARLRFVSTLCAAEAQPCLYPELSHSSKWCFNAPRSHITKGPTHTATAASGIGWVWPEQIQKCRERKAKNHNDESHNILSYFGVSI